MTWANVGQTAYDASANFGKVTIEITSFIGFAIAGVLALIGLYLIAFVKKTKTTTPAPGKTTIGPKPIGFVLVLVASFIGGISWVRLYFAKRSTAYAAYSGVTTGVRGIEALF